MSDDELPARESDLLEELCELMGMGPLEVIRLLIRREHAAKRATQAFARELERERGA